MKLFYYILFLFCLSSLQANAPVAQATMQAQKHQKTKKKRVIGSAWREATARVYIRGSESSTLEKPLPYVSPHLEPEVQPEQKKSLHQEEVSPKMHVQEEASPEQLNLFLAQLETLLNMPDDDDDLDETSFDQLFK